MKQFLRLIKQAALEAVDARKPCDVMTATVTGVSPLSITFGGSLKVPEELLMITDAAREGLFVGARVAVIRKQGGQSFLIVGTIN